MTEKDNGEKTTQLTKWEDSGIALDTVGLARAMVASGYFKNISSTAQAIVKIEMGKSLGVTPVEAMQYLHIFSTKGDRTNIMLGYPLVGALIQRSGKYHFDVKERTEKECEIDFYQIGPAGEMKKLGTSRFTIERATKAGLVTKDVWEHYPDVMLYARALSHGAKAFCPEVLSGADVVADEPYIEGTARQIGDEERVVEEPPEGFTDHWTRLWAFAKSDPPEGLGMTEEEVHEFFGVESLKDAVANVMQETGKTEPQVVAEFEMALRQRNEQPETSGDGGLDLSPIWLVAEEQGMDKAAVHGFFKLPAFDGALTDYAEIRAKWGEKPLAQVVQDMADELQLSHESAKGTGAEPEAEAVQ
jgi:hypothetical protein